MDSTIALGFKRDRHVEAPFVVAFTAPHPDADHASKHRRPGHEWHSRELLAFWAGNRELLPVAHGVRH